MEKITFIILLLSIIFIKPAIAQETILRIPLHASAISLDPSKVQDVSSLWVSRQINCQLVRMNKSVPSLDAAQSIQYINPTLIDVKLKNNIYFANGSKMTAQDVIASFNYLRKKQSVLRDIFSWIKAVTFKNKYELLIQLKRPTTQMLMILSAPHYAIFEKTFIAKVTKDSSLWREPVGCGDYKIDESNPSFVKLSPIKGKGFPILFFLIPDSQLLAKDLDKYDLVSMQVMGQSDTMSHFNLVNIFDPFQYYFILNTRIPPWNKRENRCTMFAKLNPDTVINVYEDRAKRADDFLPSGTLGYQKNNNYMKEVDLQFSNLPVPSKKTICVSFVATSIEKNYRSAYLDMIKKIYPNTVSKIINNYTDLNHELNKQNCDGVFYAAKSNYLDAYEYFLTFAEKGPSASGFHDQALASFIKESQKIDRRDLLAKQYHKIVNYIKRECLMYPLFTVPYDIVYVKNSIEAVGIGEGAVNEYSLANVK